MRAVSVSAVGRLARTVRPGGWSSGGRRPCRPACSRAAWYGAGRRSGIIFFRGCGGRGGFVRRPGFVCGAEVFEGPGGEVVEPVEDGAVGGDADARGEALEELGSVEGDSVPGGFGATG